MSRILTHPNIKRKKHLRIISEHYEEQHHTDVRLLRPYYPDGTSIATPLEEHHLRVAAETRAQEAEAEIERLRVQLVNRQISD